MSRDGIDDPDGSAALVSNSPRIIATPAAKTDCRPGVGLACPWGLAEWPPRAINEYFLSDRWLHLATGLREEGA